MSSDPVEQALRLPRTNFLVFLELAFSRVSPGKRMEMNWHHEAIAALVEQVMAAPSMRAMVLIPPRHLKSYIVSICLPAFLLGQDPRKKIVVTTYSEDLTQNFSEGTALLMESTLYKALFPDTVLRRKTRKKLETTMGGEPVRDDRGGADHRIWWRSADRRRSIERASALRPPIHLDRATGFRWVSGSPNDKA